MGKKEAQARVKIDKHLEAAGWRLLDEGSQLANVKLEQQAKITPKTKEEMGTDYEKTVGGFADYVLYGSGSEPLAILEAKSEEKEPLVGKEQARRYALSLDVQIIILSNGNTHYFWNIESGSPTLITKFPTQESLLKYSKFEPNAGALADEKIEENYIALTQNSTYFNEPLYMNEPTRQDFIKDSRIRFLRHYQLEAVKSLQAKVREEEGTCRFLFEMATGTGKTLVAAAVIKLFLRTGNARRVLFLVDRLELENQAFISFQECLKNDYRTVIYKQNRDDWQKAEIVISTVQSLSSREKYKELFTPLDFDLVISDEAHRSISGNSRAVFEYFLGYKLGLTATPRDYIKNVDVDEFAVKDPRAWERRQLLDTYATFGCESGEPTYRYALLDGVNDDYLINPIAIDARTHITTQLLSDEGYGVLVENEAGEMAEEFYKLKDFEKNFFSHKTNQVFCEAILKNALPDPLSGEIGKTIAFCVSQNHATEITQMLNELAHRKWPKKYNSDFAVQVTSNVQNSQEMATRFAANRLNGKTNFLENYSSSKARVCVTVSMMTTGYDCPDILNLALLRPVFSPTNFIQIKGRGTRKYIFQYVDVNSVKKEAAKKNFKFFDFFANFEYFENEFDYDEKLPLPQKGKPPDSEETDDILEQLRAEISDPDHLTELTETAVGTEGMAVDKKLFQKAKAEMQKDKELEQAVNAEDWNYAVEIAREKYDNKPELFITLEKLRAGEGLDRRLSWREVIERAYGYIDFFKTSDEKLDEEFEKFLLVCRPDDEYISYARNYFENYVLDSSFRNIIDERRYADLATHPAFSQEELSKLGMEWVEKISAYIRDYVPLMQYEPISEAA